MSHYSSSLARSCTLADARTESEKFTMRADEFIELAVTKSGDRRSYDAVEDSWEGLARYYGNLCSSRTISPRGIVPEII